MCYRTDPVIPSKQIEIKQEVTIIGRHKKWKREENIFLSKVDRKPVKQIRQDNLHNGTEYFLQSFQQLKLEKQP